MTLEELANRLDDLVVAVERVADVLERQYPDPEFKLLHEALAEIKD